MFSEGGVVVRGGGGNLWGFVCAILAAECEALNMIHKLILPDQPSWKYTKKTLTIALFAGRFVFEFDLIVFNGKTGIFYDQWWIYLKTKQRFVYLIIRSCF